MSLGTLGAILLGNLLTSKGTITEVEGTVRAGEDTIFLFNLLILSQKVLIFLTIQIDFLLKNIKKMIK